MILSMLALVLCSITAFADELQVVVSPTEIEINENVSVDFNVTVDSMTSAVGDPSYAAPDFDEVNAYQRGTSIQSVYENGKFSVKRSERITVILHPKRTGKLKITGLKILANGKMLTSSDLTIDVVEEGKLASKNRGASNLFGRAQPPSTNSRPSLPRSGAGTSATNQGRGPSIVIKTEPDKLKVYKGEMIHLAYVLYTRAQIASMQVERFPTATGFLKEDIDVPVLRGLQNLQISRSVLNGSEYQRAVLAEYALFPVREGKLPLDVFSAKISFRSSSQNSLMDDEDPLGLNRFFQAFQLLTETQESDRKSIEVLPLPLEGQPVDFSGLVGDFTLAVDLDKTTVKAGEPFQVKVRLEGKGHPGGIERLSVDWPPAFEQYEDRSSTKFSANGKSERIFEYLMIPREAGKFSVPSIKITMFDPATKSYKTRTTEPISITVEQGDASTMGPGNVASAQRTNQASPQKAEQDIMPPVDSTALVEPVSEVKKGLSARFVLRLSAMLLLVFMSIAWLWRTGVLARLKPKGLNKKDWSRAVQELEQCTGQDVFLARVDNALTELLIMEYGVNRGSLTNIDLQAALEEKSVPKNITQSVIRLLSLIEALRFAPANPLAVKQASSEVLQTFKYIVEARS